MSVLNADDLMEEFNFDVMRKMGVKWYLHCFEIFYKIEIDRLKVFKWVFPIGYETMDKRRPYILAYLLKVPYPSQLFQSKKDFKPIENLSLSKRSVLSLDESDWQELIATPR